MTTRAGLGAVALIVVAVGAGVLTAPAAAAPPGGPTEPEKLLRLSWSQNGPWSDNLDAPLFGTADSPMVPGDSPERTFWAFNTTGTKADLALSCNVAPVAPAGTTPGTPVTAYDDLADALSLEYRVGGAGNYESCESRHTPFTVKGRTADRVDVKLSFVLPDTPEMRQVAMNQSATYSITVTLSQLPPKSGGKPQVLGTQTLVTSESGLDTTAVTTGSTSESSGEQGAASGPNGKDKGKASPTKTANASAVLPDPNASLSESMPLIGGLLVAGALLAGFRRRRREAD